MKKIIALTLVFVLALSACSNWNVEIKDPESGAQSSVSESGAESISKVQQPEFYELPAELVPLLDKENCAWQDISAVLTRTEEGFSAGCGGNNEEQLATAINSFVLRKAVEGETAEYYLAHPFSVEFTEGEKSWLFEFKQGVVTVDGVDYVPTENLDAFTTKHFRSYDWVSSDLFTLGSVLDYGSETIVKVEKSAYGSETVTYEGAEAKDVWENNLSKWVVRNIRKTPDNPDNPNTGGAVNNWTVYFEGGDSHIISELGVIWVDEEMLYYYVG